MDLIKLLNVSILDYDQDVKQIKDKKKEALYEITLKNNEQAFILPIVVDNTTSENLTKLILLKAIHNQNFLKFNSLLFRNDELFIGYEVMNHSITEYIYLQKLKIEERIVLYKQLIEIILILLIFGEKFESFDFNMFFIDNKLENNSIIKLLYFGIF